MFVVLIIKFVICIFFLCLSSEVLVCLRRDFKKFQFLKPR